MRLLQDEIRTLKWDNNTPIFDYLNQAKSLFDSLKQADGCTDEDELITYTLDGLGIEYRNLATTMVADWRPFNRNQNSFSTHGGNRGHGRANRGRGRRLSPSGYPPSTWNQGRPPHDHPPPTLSDRRPPLLPTPVPASSRKSLICLRRDKMGHIAWFCPDRGPQALMAQHASLPKAAQNSTWCFDSWVTHHITPDSGGISDPQPYTGTDTIVVGNGNELKITHIGNSN